MERLADSVRESAIPTPPTLDELKEKIDVVKISTYNHRKWKRLIEIYANTERE